MLKPVFTLILCLLLSGAFAQKKDSVVYYLDKKGHSVVKDSAVYSMVILPPDSTVDKSLFIVKGYHKNGTLKMLAYSKTNNLNLKFQGAVTIFFPNGHKMRITNYNNGELTGDFTEYYPNGMFYNRQRYPQSAKDDAKSLLIDCSDPDGKVLATNGNGQWLRLNGDLTKIVEEGPVVNGVEEGNWRSKKSDTVETISEYRKGKIVSVADQYKSGSKVYLYVEKAPEFPGGPEGFGKFIANNIRYPANARKNGVKGNVTISFIIEKDGTVSKVKVVKGIGSGCDEEAVRVLKLSPAWDPGVQDGKPVSVLLNIPISFSLGKNSK